MADELTSSILHLLSIMQNKRETARKRIDAAQCLLDFESPPQVVARTRTFLERVLENTSKFRTEHRLLASKLLRRVEAKKVQQGTVAAVETAESRELDRRMARAHRRMKLDALGLWPAPENWCDDLLSPDMEPVEQGSVG